MQPPPTKYVDRKGVSIAYQVVGDGPFDLLFAPGFVSHLDLQWTDPGFSRFLTRLASFSRLIMFDKPGTGLSDPIPHIAALEERVADMVAVLDAAGSERASVLGFSEGGPASILLTATHPERVRSLALFGTFAVHMMAMTPEELAELDPARRDAFERVLREMDDLLSHWGEGLSGRLFAPSLTNDMQRRFLAMFERAAASPSMAKALVGVLAQIDVRGILSSVQCPTLVLHLRDDRVLPAWTGERLAEGIPGARFVVLEGSDHAFWFGDFDPVLDEIERFLSGTVRALEPDRVLATVLFTDIVGSTERAAAMGDTAWRQLLERHNELITATVVTHGGRVVEHVGDGALSTFGGPAKAVRCAHELCTTVRELGIELRAGVHTGECEAMGDGLGGLAVHIGARVGALAEPGEVLVSSTVKELVVGSGMRFSDRGERELKGVPGEWRVYALREDQREESRPEPLDAAADHMRLADRMAVSLARRAPRTMRLGARLASRGE